MEAMPVFIQTQNIGRIAFFAYMLTEITKREMTFINSWRKIALKPYRVIIFSCTYKNELCFGLGQFLL